mmetsp:Transcript_44247/g.84604  ORF Transcript_44247/g.84604 Transcript_44247/m.84604 type:complete len:600 (+) Transcript_44247:483-2282(+)
MLESHWLLKRNGPVQGMGTVVRAHPPAHRRRSVRDLWTFHLHVALPRHHNPVEEAVRSVRRLQDGDVQVPSVLQLRLRLLHAVRRPRNHVGGVAVDSGHHQQRLTHLHDDLMQHVPGDVADHRHAAHPSHKVAVLHVLEDLAHVLERHHSGHHRRRDFSVAVAHHRVRPDAPLLLNQAGQRVLQGEHGSVRVLGGSKVVSRRVLRLCGKVHSLQKIDVRVLLEHGVALLHGSSERHAGLEQGPPHLQVGRLSPENKCHPGVAGSETLLQRKRLDNALTLLAIGNCLQPPQQLILVDGCHCGAVHLEIVVKGSPLANALARDLVNLLVGGQVQVAPRALHQALRGGPSEHHHHGQLHLIEPEPRPHLHGGLAAPVDVVVVGQNRVHRVLAARRAPPPPPQAPDSVQGAAEGGGEGHLAVPGREHVGVDGAGRGGEDARPLVHELHVGAALHGHPGVAVDATAHDVASGQQYGASTYGCVGSNHRVGANDAQACNPAPLFNHHLVEAERAGEAVAEEGGALSDVHVVLDVQLVVVRSDERGDAHVLAHLRPKPSVHPNDQRRVFVGRPDLHADKVADAEYPEPVGDPSRLRGVGGVALDPS